MLRCPGGCSGGIAGLGRRFQLVEDGAPALDARAAEKRSAAIVSESVLVSRELLKALNVEEK
jgi:hypothetical protein